MLLLLQLQYAKAIFTTISSLHWFWQITLWSIAKSPLMFGGDMRNLDETTFSLITNPTLLEINSFSSNNKEASE